MWTGLTIACAVSAALGFVVASGVQVNGYFLVRTPTGDASNPLWQFDGIVDLLATKG